MPCTAARGRLGEVHSKRLIKKAISAAKVRAQGFISKAGHTIYKLPEHIIQTADSS
jgi:hypothetical protein